MWPSTNFAVPAHFASDSHKNLKKIGPCPWSPFWAYPATLTNGETKARPYIDFRFASSTYFSSQLENHFSQSEAPITIDSQLTIGVTSTRFFGHSDSRGLTEVSVGFN